MTNEFTITIAMDADEKWHCVLSQEGQYSRFERPTLNAMMEEARIRMVKRVKQNNLFPVSTILGPNGHAIRPS